MNQRFVNLNRAPTHLPDPRGAIIAIRPFHEALDEHLRKPDAIYVVEGAFWQKYASGTKAGPLHPFPDPKGFGRAEFPALPVHRRDGSEGDGLQRTDGSAGAPVAVQAVPGRFRAAGDVLTPEGKIRRRNPVTGADELVEDTPANRNVLPPVNEPGPAREKLRESIVDYLEAMGIETVAQFDALTDEQLLKIPGMDPLALKHVRANMRQLLAQIERAAIEEINDTASRTGEPGSEDAAADDSGDDSGDDDNDDDAADDRDDEDEDAEDVEDEETADGRTGGSAVEAAKSKKRYTVPTAPATPKPAHFEAKSKVKPKVKPKSKPTSGRRSAN